MQFCGELNYGKSFIGVNFTDEGGRDITSKKANVRYNNVYLSFESSLQLSLVECSPWCKQYPPTLLLYACTECIDYLKSVGYNIQDVQFPLVVVLIQGYQPFHALSFLEMKAGDHILNYYRCLNRNFSLY